MEEKAISDKYSEAEISMVLDTFMYLDYKDGQEGSSLSEIVKELANQPDYGGGGIHYGEYTVLKEAVQSKEIGSLRIYCQSSNMGYDTGTCACTFRSADRKNIYVVYRGTGDGEWLDNGIGMTSAVTTQQEKALSYFEEAMEVMKPDEKCRVIVTGHSKGGNKAQFVTMESKYGNCVDACYSVDGQGFSEDAIDRWKEKYGEEEYRERREKLHGIHGENDYVSVLGHSIIPQGQIRYVKTPVGKADFAGYHDIKYMFSSLEYSEKTGKYQNIFHGRKNSDVGGMGVLGLYAAALSKEVMSLKPEQRDGCAAVIMQMMEAVKGRKDGINGEKLQISDFADFAFQGIPQIRESLTGKEDGQKFLEAAFARENFTLRPSSKTMLQVNLQTLLKQSEQLRNAVGHAKRLTEEVRGNANMLPSYMKGYTSIYHRIKLSAMEMERLTEKLMKICQFHEDATECYRGWNQ